MEWHNSIDTSSKNLPLLWHQSPSCSEKLKCLNGPIKCQTICEDIKNHYIQVPILISPNWELEFHVHTNASHFTIRAILTQNPTGKIN
jgi:hypothetical protein